MKKLLQNSLLFFLISSILCFNLKISIVQFEYSFLNAIFTAQFCENKSKPELDCKGTCQLKKVKQDQENQDSSTNSLVESQVLFFEETPEFNFYFQKPLQKTKFYSTINLFKSEIPYQLIHPPEAFI